ncbi:MAG TPA: sigma-70 family RNA polymerase sigma factor [Paucimonas sp.]|nr:sigma-70 family RNA polymerase sigma factor [Paucimonas sp.]
MKIASYFRTRKAASAEARKRQDFQRIALPHLNAAYRLARWLARNHDDAEEIVQEAYLSAYRHFDSYRGGDARAWILTIVRNMFYSALRQRQAVTEAFDEDVHNQPAESLGKGAWNGPDPEAALLRSENAAIVRDAVEALPVELREVLVLRTFDELSYCEIAAVANIPIGTVMSRLSRARQQLAHRLKPMNGEP